MQFPIARPRSMCSSAWPGSSCRCSGAGGARRHGGLQGPPHVHGVASQAISLVRTNPCTMHPCLGACQQGCSRGGSPRACHGTSCQESAVLPHLGLVLPLLFQTARGMVQGLFPEPRDRTPHGVLEPQFCAVPIRHPVLGVQLGFARVLLEVLLRWRCSSSWWSTTSSSPCCTAVDTGTSRANGGRSLVAAPTT